MLVNVPHKMVSPGLFSGASRASSALGKPLIPGLRLEAKATAFFLA